MKYEHGYGYDMIDTIQIGIDTRRILYKYSYSTYKLTHNVQIQDDMLYGYINFKDLGYRYILSTTLIKL